MHHRGACTSVEFDAIFRTFPADVQEKLRSSELERSEIWAEHPLFDIKDDDDEEYSRRAQQLLAALGLTERFAELGSSVCFLAATARGEAEGIA